MLVLHQAWIQPCVSRSRLAGNKPKEVSQKLNFNSFLEHYQAYPTAQTLYNKMVRLI